MFLAPRGVEVLPPENLPDYNEVEADCDGCAQDLHDDADFEFNPRSILLIERWIRWQLSSRSLVGCVA